MAEKKRKNYPLFASYREDMRDLDVLVALIPIVIWSLIIFGVNSLLFITLGVLSSVVFELIAEFCLYKTIGKDLANAVLIGLLISLSVSPEAPLWLPVLGSAVGIFAAKYQFFVFAEYGSFFSPVALGILVCAVYPENKNAFLDAVRDTFYPEEGMLNLFLGNTRGALGTVSAMLVTVAAVYLICKKVLSIKTFTLSVFVMVTLSALLVPQWTTFSENIIYQVIGGGFLFYLVFVACDRIASPLTETGKLIHGALFAALVFVLRMYTSLPACEALSAVIMNIFTPIIDAFTRQTPFGGGVRKVNKTDK